VPATSGQIPACLDAGAPPTAVRAVIDTNVLVSGLLVAEGPPRQVLDAWLDGRFTLVTSPYQLEELTHVLAYSRVAERIRVAPAELAAILSGLMTLAVVTPGDLPRPGVTRDPKDDAIVACAEESAAEYIVSGNLDLLSPGENRGFQAVTPRQLLEVIARP
jgi:putative PIN family toxin of toxin-antitoxin system